MTDIGDIPLTDLLTWDGNVRKTGAQEGLEELMASIQAHGLLQPLVVKPAPDKDKTKGKYPHSGMAEHAFGLIPLRTLLRRQNRRGQCLSTISVFLYS